MRRQLTELRQRCKGRLHVALAFALFVALSAVAPGPALAAGGPVLVLRASELPPYKAVEASFNSALGQPTKSVPLSGGNSKEVVKGALAESPPLVFAIGPDAAKAMVEVGGSTLTLYALVPNPARIGLDPRAAGVSMFASPTSQMQAIRALLPGAKKIGVLYDPAISAALVAEFETAAASVGATLVKKEIGSAKDVASGARELLSAIDALLLIPDTSVISAETFKFIAQTSLESKVPLVGFSEGMSKAGAVLAIEGSYEEIGKKAAVAARRMLAGGGGLREAPEGSVFVNAKSAQLLGLAISPALRARASRVFE